MNRTKTAKINTVLRKTILAGAAVETMKVEFYEMDSDGWLSDEPRGTLEYKRQKKQTKKKQGDQPVQKFKELY